jgi:hypothetical protein
MVGLLVARTHAQFTRTRKHAHAHARAHTCKHANRRRHKADASTTLASQRIGQRTRTRSVQPTRSLHATHAQRLLSGARGHPRRSGPSVRQPARTRGSGRRNGARRRAGDRRRDRSGREEAVDRVVRAEVVRACMWQRRTPVKASHPTSVCRRKPTAPSAETPQAHVRMCVCVRMCVRACA